MTITVKIPTPLRPHAGGRDHVAVEGRTVREVLDNLGKECEGIPARIRDESGGVKRFVNLFVNQEDVRFLDGLDTEVADGDVVSIIPAVAGGATGGEEPIGAGVGLLELVETIRAPSRARRRHRAPVLAEPVSFPGT